MSADSRTRQYPPPPPPAKRSGLNPLTLAIAAVSAVAAAFVVSKIWAGGTLMATAMTPVIVAIVKEALERPAQKIDVGVSRLSTVRREHPDGLVVEEFEPGHEAEPNDISVYSSRGGSGRWKFAAVTGLVAAVVAIAALTLPELVAGRSLFNSGKETTLFQGRRHRSTTTTTQSTQTQTVTQTTATQTVTQTVPSTTQTTPTVTQTTPTTTQQTPGATSTPTTPSGGATTPTTPSP
jgi:hypothetical protein